jgi:hypothetical protein
LGFVAAFSVFRHTFSVTQYRDRRNVIEILKTDFKVKFKCENRKVGGLEMLGERHDAIG